MVDLAKTAVAVPEVAPKTAKPPATPTRGQAPKAAFVPAQTPVQAPKAAVVPAKTPFKTTQAPSTPKLPNNIKPVPSSAGTISRLKGQLNLSLLMGGQPPATRKMLSPVKEDLSLSLILEESVSKEESKDLSKPLESVSKEESKDLSKLDLTAAKYKANMAPKKRPPTRKPRNIVNA